MWRGRAGALPAAIGALCRALPPGGRPAPETFRLAKFDRPEASLQIWRLLYSLLKQIHDGGWTEPDIIGTQIRFVKSVLRYHGYGRPEFYQLPSDGSQGSRELLLAFSWLLNRISLLERLLTVNRVKIGDEASVCTCEDNLSNSWKDRTEIALEPYLKREVDIRYLQWLTGRLRFQWRSLHVDCQEQCKLLHKIHSYTSGCHMDQTIGHFSVTETDLIRQPDSYKQVMLWYSIMFCTLMLNSPYTHTGLHSTENEAVSNIFSSLTAMLDCPFLDAELPASDSSGNSSCSKL
ncbi:chemokine-like receptor 1 [Platysternon megacephalum]|uniref:Chemokine-like receptor 1 n=1 Tax=Platysternon megacephalum TaxID=55544 RepID=A0A4D9DLW1_9SAUR|nr:chemokine-like receptor 1 [Platysternon megacephalum]